MNTRILVILIDQSSAASFSLFDPNGWGQKSKPIIQSCAANHGLITYSVTKIENVFSQAASMCRQRLVLCKVVINMLKN
jgi:hypothetical protein